MAAKEVQAYIGSHMEIREDADKGKMFGVLVVEHEGGLAYLAAYSGLLAGRNDWSFFVPPVYDAQQPDGHFKTTEREISLISHHSPLIAKKMSQDLQVWLFHQYQLLNARGPDPNCERSFPCLQVVRATVVPPNCCSMPISRA